MFRSEAHREQIFQKNYLIKAIAFTQNNPESFRITEFPEYLTADAAGRTEIRDFAFLSADDTYC